VQYLHRRNHIPRCTCQNKVCESENDLLVSCNDLDAKFCMLVEVIIVIRIVVPSKVRDWLQNDWYTSDSNLKRLGSSRMDSDRDPSLIGERNPPKSRD
jgi:hypothetical protein